MEQLNNLITKYTDRLSDELKNSDQYVRFEKLDQLIKEQKQKLDEVQSARDAAVENGDYDKIFDFESKKNKINDRIAILKSEQEKLNPEQGLSFQEVQIIVNQFESEARGLIEIEENKYFQVLKTLQERDRQLADMGKALFLFEDYLHDKYHYNSALQVSTSGNQKLVNLLGDIVTKVEKCK